MTTQVTKIDGSQEPYNEEKIRTSARRVGVPDGLLNDMLMLIRDRLYDGIKTSEIFLMIKEFLRNAGAPYLATKYNLKDALSQLGPSGYPFEKYVSLLLADVGYVTTTNQIIAGSCILHEIDVLAEKDNITYFIEAKFHKNQSQRTDARVALYIKARYDDLKNNWHRGATRAWIVTNTRFSTDAIKYGECQNIRLMSWGYPKGEGIMDLIEHTRLHPITIIEELNQADKIRLFAAGIVTCKQLLTPQGQALIPSATRQAVLMHLEHICQNKT